MTFPSLMKQQKNEVETRDRKMWRLSTCYNRTPTQSGTDLWLGEDIHKHKSATRKSIHFLHISNTFVTRSIYHHGQGINLLPPCELGFVSLAHCSGPHRQRSTSLLTADVKSFLSTVYSFLLVWQEGGEGDTRRMMDTHAHMDSHNSSCPDSTVRVIKSRKNRWEGNKRNAYKILTASL
jgi:hypothetical protein